MHSFLGVIHITLLANIGPCDFPRTSPSNARRTFSKDPIWLSQGRLNLTSRGSPNLTSWGSLKMTSRGHPDLTLKGCPWEVNSGSPQDVVRTIFFLTFLSELIRLTKSIWKHFNTQGVFRTLWNFQYEAFSEKLVNAFLAANYFRDRTSS